jgi:outer membrane immunogenic protein
MKRLLIACSMGFALASGPVLAADITAKAPGVGLGAPTAAISSEVYDWTGWYGGVSIGLALGRSKQTSSTGDLTPNFDVDGGVFGFATGYNWQTGRIVFGLDSDYSFSTIQGSSGFLTAAPGFVAETKERWLTTSRARIGLARNTWMVYVTGGAAAADVGIVATEPGAGIASEDKVRWGWTTGVGVEAARLFSFSVKAEYLFVNFQNPAYFNPPPGSFNNRAGGVPINENILRIGLNHKIDF